MKKQSLNLWEKGAAFFQRALGVDPGRMVKSISAFSRIFAVFAVLFLGAFIYKIVASDANGTGLKLTDGFKLDWLYATDKFQFGLVSSFESARLILIAVFFFYFDKFIRTIDIQDPFSNPDSKSYISSVALWSVIFFLVDAAGAVHLKFIAESAGITEKVRVFHFEYLFLMYFINVFSSLFSKGVDLKNEINMVV